MHRPLPTQSLRRRSRVAAAAALPAADGDQRGGRLVHRRRWRRRLRLPLWLLRRPVEHEGQRLQHGAHHQQLDWRPPIRTCRCLPRGFGQPRALPRAQAAAQSARSFVYER